MNRKKLFIFFILSFLLIAFFFISPTYRIFAFIPFLIFLNFAKEKHLKNAAVIIVVVLWLFLFHYESTRYFFHDFPKTKFLFPPYGWIMFFRVDDDFSYVEVYGKKGEQIELIDPHDIFRTRTIGFDNIHRNILSSVAARDSAKSFCPFLKYRFPYFDSFFVTYVYYPSITKEPGKRLEEVLYTCGE